MESNINNKKKSLEETLPFFIIFLSFVFSTIADIFMLNKSVLNVLVVTIFMFMSLPYIGKYSSINKNILKLSNVKSYLFFLCWIFIVLLFTNSDVTAVSRFFVFLIYFLLYILYLIQFKSNYDTILYGYRFIALLIIVYLIIINMLNHNFALNLNYVMFGRYKGIAGPNYHGIISAIGFMFSMSTYLIYKFENTYKKYLYLLFVIISLINVYITGSRASWIVCLFYLFIYTYIKFRIYKSKRLLFRCLFFIFLITLFLILSYILYVSSYINMNYIKDLFRFDSYSTLGRLSPIYNAIDILKENNYMPYGLGKQNMTELLKNTPLDNSYLTISIESGLIGLSLLLLFLLKMLLLGIKTVKKLSQSVSAKDKISLGNIDRELFISSFSIMLSLFLHGLFENFIFNGLQLGSLILFFCFSTITIINYRINR